MDFKVLTEYPENAVRVQWEEFLRRAAYPTHYTTPNFFTDPYIRGDKFAVLAMDGEEVAAVLTGVENGKRIASGLAVRPQVIFGRDCDRLSALRAFSDGMMEKGGKALELIDLHTWEAVDGAEALGFRSRHCTDDDSIIMLDLSAGADEIFKGFSQTRRNEIRRELKKNLVAIKELETGEEIIELYDIHKDWNSRKGNDPDAFETFEKAMKQRENRKVIIALYEGKIIAGSYYRFCPGGVVEYAANNSLPEFQRLRPNDLIGWHAIQWACAGGFTHFSMGGSHLFLRRFGGEVFSAWHYRLDRTFLKRHEVKDSLKNFAVRTYLALPDSARNRIKQTLGKA
jgi:Acetyltransferase (GNAT) domain